MREIAPAESFITPTGKGDELITFVELENGGDSSAFRTLNEEWITRFFSLEDRDRELLNDPKATILERGGHIYFACYAGAEIGCAALVPAGEGVFELSKMAVAPAYQGRGIGRRLLLHVMGRSHMGGGPRRWMEPPGEVQSGFKW